MNDQFKESPAQNGPLNSRCRTVDLGLEHFSECPERGPNPCAYAVPFGYCFLCSYPRIVEVASPRGDVALDA